MMRILLIVLMFATAAVSFFAQSSDSSILKDPVTLLAKQIESGEVRKRTLTVFCPDIGIVLRETQAQAASEVALERIELKSYGPAFSYDPTAD